MSRDSLARLGGAAYNADMSEFTQRVFEIASRIPYGRVVTYGQIAFALGSPRGARQVGWAMHKCPEGVPWHRVVNGKGMISLPSPENALQRALLEDEGVEFDQGRIDLDRYAWDIRHEE